MAAKKTIETTKTTIVKRGVSSKVGAQPVTTKTDIQSMDPKAAVSKTTDMSTLSSRRSARVKMDVKQSTLKIDVVNTQGKAAGQIEVPGEIFAAPVNQNLMTQAVRVYLTNQHQGTAHAKTRGEVNATTKKVYRQKGTGRARHGAMSAPTYVGGGKAHGPQPHTPRLSMPTKMRRQALFSALTSQLQNKNVMIVDGLANVEVKTKAMVNALQAIVPTEGKKQQKILIVAPNRIDSVIRSSHNIPFVAIDQAANLHTYEILNAQKIIFMKDAIESIKSTFLGKGEEK